MVSQVRESWQLIGYQTFHIDKEHPLGHGAYGAVYKAKCDQLPCAAKILHQTILDPRDPGVDRVMQKFQLECSMLERIRHPNIVQYLGLCRDPESRLPALLMELLDESLTKMLEHSKRPLSYFVQVNICHDVAIAVAYLHSNDIIHRDLSSNNVLIMAKSRAKVTDFGMSKLAGAAPTMTPLTMCPGTPHFMAPEALEEPPRYTKKLDCFSEGVIMIQVCTRLWPEPGPRTKSVSFPASPTGVIQMPVLEIERRRNHIDLIDSRHPLLPIAKDCLHYQERERPSSEELCQRLAALKESTEYRESVQQVEREEKDIAMLERRIREMQAREAVNVKQLQRKDVVIQSKDNQLQQLETELRSQSQRLNQQLEEREQVITEIQQTNHSLHVQVEQLQQQLSQQISSTRKSIQPLPPVAVKAQIKGRELWQNMLQPPRVQSSIMSTKKSVTITEWKDGVKAPIRMRRGACVVDGRVAYFMNYDDQIYSFNSCTKSWSQLPRCSCYGSSLAVVGGLLTTIGGLKVRRFSNPVIDFKNTLRSIVDKKWVKHFPPMPTKRCDTAAVTTKQHLIVAGGGRGEGPMDTVEVLDTETLVWSVAASLPRFTTRESATICGDHLYMLGGVDRIGELKSVLVLTCSLTELLESRGEVSSGSVWRRITDAPVVRSTCVAVSGELLAIGGEDTARDKYTAYSAVYKYIQHD